MSLVTRVENLSDGIRIYLDKDHTYFDISASDYNFGILTYQKVQEFLLSLKGRNLLLDKLVDKLIDLGPQGLKELLK